MPQKTADRIIREPERRALTGISRTAWADGEKQGRFPRRRSLGPHQIGWLETELVAWMRRCPQVGGVEGEERAAP